MKIRIIDLIARAFGLTVVINEVSYGAKFSAERDPEN